MRLENRTDRATTDILARKISDGKFMKKNNITHQSHEEMDMGLDISDDTYVTVWVPRNQ